MYNSKFAGMYNLPVKGQVNTKSKARIRKTRQTRAIRKFQRGLETLMIAVFNLFFWGMFFVMFVFSLYWYLSSI